MFESDDFDQILSQFDFPEVAKTKLPLDPKDPSNPNNEASATVLSSSILLLNNSTIVNNEDLIIPVSKNNDSLPQNCNSMSHKHSKRKIINSYFDHNNKRKFPGPAGILTDTLKEPKDDSMSHIELLSQDIDSTQNHLRRDIFDSPLWCRILSDIKKWSLPEADSIKSIKQHSLLGSLKRRKAQTVVAFIESVDRSVTDPLVTLRDNTGSIKCTLHRDAWSTFSLYVVAEYCALVLWKPTILTTGSAFKKHYLNITLGNIYAIYSSVVHKDEMENKTLTEGYSIICEEDCTVIKAESPLNIETNTTSNINDTDDIYDGLDSIFSDDVF